MCDVAALRVHCEAVVLNGCSNDSAGQAALASWVLEAAASGRQGCMYSRARVSMVCPKQEDSPRGISILREMFLVDGKERRARNKLTNDIIKQR